jgi:endonuclease/exonuclease/phosphatase family metal-dependent hydrolase
VRTARFVTFNVRYDKPDPGERCWTRRKRLVRSAIRRLRPTVIGVQEARPNQYADLQAWFPQYSWLGTCRRGDGTGEHVVLGFDERCCRYVDGGGFWLSETPRSPSVGWDGARPRVATWADLRVGDRPLTVVTTHLDHAGERARRNGAELLCQFLRTLPNRTVLLGDLNATPSAPALEPFGDHGYDPARERARFVDGSADTFHGFGEGPHERIDYVLPSPELTVVRAGTLDSEPPYPSDHEPVFADVATGRSDRDGSGRRSH